MAGPYSGALREFAGTRHVALNDFQRAQSQAALAAPWQGMTGTQGMTPFQAAYQAQAQAPTGQGIGPYLPAVPQAPSQAQQAFTNWQAQQYDAAAHNTQPQGGYQASAIWGNYLRNQATNDPAGSAASGQMSPAQAQAKLDAERAVAFRDLENVRRFYDRPEAIETQNAIMAQLRGDSQPFGQDVQQAMFADAADAGAGQYAAAQDAYQQQAANAGVKVGGAMYNVARDVGAQTRKARRDIRSRAALENFQAKERAQGAAANYLRDKSAAQWAPVLRSTEMRERFQVTGQSPEAANPAALGMGGASGIPQGGMNAVSYNPYAPGSSGGGLTMANGQPKGGSSYGGVTKIDGMNAAPWRSGGSSGRNNRGGSMGFNLTTRYDDAGNYAGGYTNYMPGEKTRYGDGGLNYQSSGLRNANPGSGQAGTVIAPGVGLTGTAPAALYDEYKLRGKFGL